MDAPNPITTPTLTTKTQPLLNSKYIGSYNAETSLCMNWLFGHGSIEAL